MLNLLPQKKKESIKREYHSRLVIISLLFAIGALVIWVIFLMPSYLIAKAKFDNANSQNEALKSKVDTITNTETNFTTKQRNEITVLQSATSTALFPTDLFDSVLKYKGKNISITDFNLEKNNTGDEQFFVHGLAKTRNDLISFKDSLEKDQTWSKVDLPIEDLGPATANQFTFTLTVSQK